MVCVRTIAAPGNPKTYSRDDDAASVMIRQPEEDVSR